MRPFGKPKVKSRKLTLKVDNKTKSRELTLKVDNKAKSRVSVDNKAKQ